MTREHFHNLHEGQTRFKQHWKKDGTDEFIGYKYIEKNTKDKSCCVFLPTYINPDDYQKIQLEQIMNNVLDAEFGNVL